MAARRFLKRANESGASSKSTATPRTWSDRIVNIGTGLMPEVQKPDAEDVGAPPKGPGARWYSRAESITSTFLEQHTGRQQQDADHQHLAG